MRVVAEELELFYVGLHLRVGVRHRVCNVHLVAGIHEAILKAHRVVSALPLRVQVIDLL